MILRFEFMRDMAARVSVANALRGAIPKFDSDPDFRSRHGSDLLISETRRPARILVPRRKILQSPLERSERKSGSESNFVGATESAFDTVIDGVYTA